MSTAGIGPVRCRVRNPPDTAARVCHRGLVLFDSEHLWHAIEARDPRFDGWVFAGVTTTGIYCRPSCPARTPKREHVRLFASAAAAQAAGLRACMRCRPDASPGSPEWDRRADLVGRAMRLIADGVVDREGVAGLSRRLGYAPRHVHRQLVGVVGVGPLALARAQRAQTARLLLETTALPVAEVALAAGFGSVRQFNATVKEVFALTPGGMRDQARRGGRALDSGAIVLRLPHRAPFDADGLLAFLAPRSVPGVEEVVDRVYRRSMRLPHGAGVVELEPADGHVRARYMLDDLKDLGAAVQRTRALLDLDSDPHAVLAVLGSDPLLAALVASAPGRRVPGHVHAHELAVRAVLGQQVSVAGAGTLAARLVEAHGERLSRSAGSVTHLFPAVETIAALDPGCLPMPRSRSTALITLARSLADGELVLDPGADRHEARNNLLALQGVGPWTAEYIAMRGLRDPDAFLPTDLGVRHALTQLGHDSRPAAAVRLAERWRPYRAYALTYLWSYLAGLGRPRAIRSAA